MRTRPTTACKPRCALQHCKVSLFLETCSGFKEPTLPARVPTSSRSSVLNLCLVPYAWPSDSQCPCCGCILVSPVPLQAPSLAGWASLPLAERLWGVCWDRRLRHVAPTFPPARQQSRGLWCLLEGQVGMA